MQKKKYFDKIGITEQCYVNTNKTKVNVIKDKWLYSKTDKNLVIGRIAVVTEQA